MFRTSNSQSIRIDCFMTNCDYVFIAHQFFFFKIKPRFANKTVLKISFLSKLKMSHVFFFSRFKGISGC